ncbi:MAG TPA: hypothetical protein VFF16_11630, partial [Telluria sp.]|nr:hypothetical protein [Telluria sp.]
MPKHISAGKIDCGVSKPPPQLKAPIGRGLSMQHIATYSFEAAVTDSDPRFTEIEKLVDGWLAQKGATEPNASDGDFSSKTRDGNGQFWRRTVESALGKLMQVELIETSSTGAMFTTALQVAQTQEKLVIFTSLSATSSTSQIAPVKLAPRCPRIVRDLIEGYSDWKYGKQDVPIGKPFPALDELTVSQLCDAIRSSQRRFPIVVVSMDQDEQIWNDLHTKVAEHLIGLADVAYVNEESSWLLTDELGQ